MSWISSFYETFSTKSNAGYKASYQTFLDTRPLFEIKNKPGDFKNISFEDISLLNQAVKENKISTLSKSQQALFKCLDIDGDNNISQLEFNFFAKKDKNDPINSINESEFVDRVHELMDFSQNKPNSKIDDFIQGKTGDCWFLAFLEASKTPKDQKLIKDHITYNKDDESYTITLNNKKYNVTKEDYFDPYNDKLSTGDPDVKILEIALRKYIDHHPFYKGDPGLWLSNLITKTDQLDDGLHSDKSAPFLKKLFGVNMTQISATQFTCKKEKVVALLDKLAKSGKPFSITTSVSGLSNLNFSDSENISSDEKHYDTKDINNEPLKILKNHAHTITAINSDKKTITIKDSNTLEPFTISWETYLNIFYSIELFD